MLTANDSYFDTRNEEEARNEQLKESIFIRDVLKTICRDTLAKARKSNQFYTKLSKEHLDKINKNLKDEEIKSAYYTYKL